mgnify:CR=1 FL=1
MQTFSVTLKCTDQTNVLRLWASWTPREGGLNGLLIGCFEWTHQNAFKQFTKLPRTTSKRLRNTFTRQTSSHWKVCLTKQTYGSSFLLVILYFSSGRFGPRNFLVVLPLRSRVYCLKRFTFRMRFFRRLTKQSIKSRVALGVVLRMRVGKTNIGTEW